jgi:hypothetical protein
MLGTVLWILNWVVWPTWILLIDAEHTVQIVVMLLLAAPLNGLWYGVVGFLGWHLCRGKNTKPAAPSVLS